MGKELEKLKLHSPDWANENIRKLAEIFPNCVTETEDADGIIKRAIDYDQLRQELSDHIVDGPQERYRLDWPGKREALLTANAPIAKTLRPARDESEDFDTTQNLFIEGDNLDALKLLQENYLGKVKMIYIDPPYNTGNDFIYDDDFAESTDEFLERSNQKDEDGNRLVANPDSKGRFHSDWLSMMYSRLRLAKNLLAEDGVIFVSIDDSEQQNLRKICDEVYGEENFVAQIVRNTNSSKNQSLFVSVSHEYCLIYSKDAEILKIKHSDNKWSVPKNNVEEYIKKVKQLQSLGQSDDEITNELKILTNYPRFIDFTNYWYFDERGLYRKDNLGGVKNGNITPIFNPITKNNDPVPPGGYRYNSEKINELIKEDRIHFHTDGSLPTIKRYLSENMSQRPKSIMSDDQRPDYAMMKSFETPFDNPKQISFMTRICSVVDRDSIILDFFSGSSTTAHAVMQLNAEDGGNRKFIMVQLPEEVDPKSEAAKAGYSNIAEISKERIRRAGAKILEGECHPDWNKDTGFRVLKVDTSNMKDVFYRPDEITQEDLLSSVDNIKPDRTGEDLLFQVLVDWGVDLTLSIRHEKIDGKSVYFVDDDALIACFDTGIHEDFVKQLATHKPLRLVFRDHGFASDDVKANVAQIFRQTSPDTDIKVI